MNRLTGYSEDVISIPVSLEAAMLQFQTAINKHGSIKEVSLQDGIIKAKSRYGLQATNLEFVFEKQENITVVKCRGKSDDIGNGGAMKKIDIIIKEVMQLTQDGGDKIDYNQRSQRFTTKERTVFIAAILGLLFSIDYLFKKPNSTFCWMLLIACGALLFNTFKNKFGSIVEAKNSWRKLNWKIRTSVFIGLFVFIAGIVNPDILVLDTVTQSSWDNSVEVVEKFLKNNYLNDPSSYESVEWGKLVKDSDGTYRVYHTFRAKNALGGIITETMYFKISSEGKIISYY